MEAVLQTGGKQYLVQKGTNIKAEFIEAEVGEIVEFKGDQIISYLSNDNFKNGGNLIIKAKVLEQKRDKKIVVFKKKRRKGYKRKMGFRKEITILQIVDLL